MCCAPPARAKKPSVWDPQIVLAVLCAIFLVLGWIFGEPWLFYVSVGCGSPYALKSAWDSLRERTLDVNVLMLLAAVGAVIVGHTDDAAALLFLFALSGTLEAYAMGRTKSAIESLIKLRPDQAVRVSPAGEEIVPVEALAIDDLVRVGPFDTIPADGVVTQGEGSVDQKAMTGESTPVARGPGDAVLSGTQNLDVMLLVRVTAPVGGSVLDKIVDLVRDAQENKASGERISTWFGQRYTIFVLVAFTISLSARLMLGSVWGDALYQSLILFVALSPCALVISTPASTLSALAWAARHGVLVRGGRYIEALGQIDTIAFDKTGTLTEGRFELEEICICQTLATVGGGCEDGHSCWSGESNISDEASRLLRFAATAELHSKHPIAEAIVRAARKFELDVPEAEDHRALPGLGVEASVAGSTIRVGQPDLFPGGLPEETMSHVASMQEQGRTVAIVEIDGDFAAFALTDVVRPGTREVLASLRQVGVDRALMMTGDHERTARMVAERVGISEFHAGLLPEGKTQLVTKLTQAGRKVMMVGDGINDAPSLASAHVGVAMGGLGSDIALNAADIVLMQDRLERIPLLIKFGRTANRVIRANLLFAAGVIVMLTILSLFGKLPLPLAVLGHEGSTVLVILNGLRLLGGPKPLTPRAPVPS